MTIYKGNIGIGTTVPGTYKLNVNGNTFNNGVLGFNSQLNGSGASFPCNKINLWDASNGYYSYGFGMSGNTVDYFTNVSHRWYYGAGCATGLVSTNFGTVGMTLTNNALSVVGNLNAASMSPENVVCFSVNDDIDSALENEFYDVYDTDSE